ncbi:hypothetical protein ACFV9C_44390 [Kribbella sp. NPDC059898]|uniref:hypothetical protein n=1 Tax=Kribbella sp. NPDC059898 TaxID=3346995 RepID=UPI003668AB50
MTPEHAEYKEDPARSRSELVAALPQIRQLLEQLLEVTKPSWVQDMAPETEALFHALVAAGWLADAVVADDHAARAAKLADAAERMDGFSRSVCRRVAELQTVDELAAEEEQRRIVMLDDMAFVDRAELAVGLPNGTTTTVTVSVSGNGRVSWESPTLDLAPVDGPSQLAVTRALAQLAETLTKALPDAVFDDQG